MSCPLSAETGNTQGIWSRSTKHSGPPRSLYGSTLHRVKAQTILLCFPSSTEKSDLHPIVFSAAGCLVCKFNSHGLTWVFSKDISCVPRLTCLECWFRSKGHPLCCCSICAAVCFAMEPSGLFSLSFGHRVTLHLQCCLRGTESTQGKSREVGQRLAPCGTSCKSNTTHTGYHQQSIQHTELER